VPARSGRAEAHVERPCRRYTQAPTRPASARRRRADLHDRQRAAHHASAPAAAPRVTYLAEDLGREEPYFETGEVAAPGRVTIAGCWSSVPVALLAGEAGTPVTVTMTGCWASVLVGSVMCSPVAAIRRSGGLLRSGESAPAGRRRAGSGSPRKTARRPTGCRPGAGSCWRCRPARSRPESRGS
jgi:hypothetical protein